MKLATVRILNEGLSGVPTGAVVVPLCWADSASESAALLIWEPKLSSFLDTALPFWRYPNPASRKNADAPEVLILPQMHVLSAFSPMTPKADQTPIH